MVAEPFLFDQLQKVQTKSGRSEKWFPAAFNQARLIVFGGERLGEVGDGLGEDLARDQQDQPRGYPGDYHNGQIEEDWGRRGNQKEAPERGRPSTSHFWWFLGQKWKELGRKESGEEQEEEKGEGKERKVAQRKHSIDPQSVEQSSQNNSRKAKAFSDDRTAFVPPISDLIGRTLFWVSLIVWDAKGNCEMSN